MADKQAPPNESYEIYNIYLLRRDNDTYEDAECYQVWSWQDLPGPHGTLGGIIMALNYTTSYIAVPNGEQFDIVRVRNDPFTEVHIEPDIVVATVGAPGEDEPTLADIAQLYKNNTSYQYEQVG